MRIYRGTLHSIPYRYTLRRLAGALCVAAVCLAALSACKIQLGTATTTANGPGTTVPLTIAHGVDGSTLALLAVTINGQGPYQFALDTGASSSLIDKTLTSQLSLPVAGPPQTIAGVSSKETATPVKIARWSVGKLTLPSGTIDSAGLFDSRQSDSVRGLLGSDIWNHFGRITIDYNAGTLTVYNQTTGLRSSPIGAPVGSHLKYFGPRPETTGSWLLRTAVASSNPASRKANISHVGIGLQIQLGLVPSYMYTT